jgi:predicted Fe-S protein YdhL (DUF1289 family)
MSAAPTLCPSTPCIQVCVIDPHSALCIGCGRTLSEIAAWGSLDEAARLAIMADLEARLRETRGRQAALQGEGPCA